MMIQRAYNLRWYAAGDEKKHHWVKVSTLLMFIETPSDSCHQFEEQSDALASMGITGKSAILHAGSCLLFAAAWLPRRSQGPAAGCRTDFSSTHQRRQRQVSHHNFFEIVH